MIQCPSWLCKRAKIQKMQRNLKVPKKRLSSSLTSAVSGFLRGYSIYIGEKGLLVWFSAYLTPEGAPIQFLRHAELPPHCQPSRAMEIGSLGASLVNSAKASCSDPVMFDSEVDAGTASQWPGRSADWLQDFACPLGILIETQMFRCAL